MFGWIVQSSETSSKNESTPSTLDTLFTISLVRSHLIDSCMTGLSDLVPDTCGFERGNEVEKYPTPGDKFLVMSRTLERAKSGNIRQIIF